MAFAPVIVDRAVATGGRQSHPRPSGAFCDAFSAKVSIVRAHPEHFAAKVAERRRRLGMTILDVNLNGGPTSPTVAKAEAGALADPRPSTLAKFDAGLRWTPGSAARIYWEGQDPRPRERTTTHKTFTSGAVTIELPLERVLALMSAQSRLTELVDQQSTQKVAIAEVRDIAESLDQHIGTIVGVFVTDLLERNYSDDDQTMQPLIEHAFAEILSAPVSSDDPDRIEKLYRRWLLGKSAETPPDLVPSFRRRLRRKLTSEGQA
jgi:hypothetical protein